MAIETHEDRVLYVDGGQLGIRRKSPFIIIRADAQRVVIPVIDPQRAQWPSTQQYAPLCACMLP